MILYRFEDMPPLGTQLWLDAQRYDLIAVEPHQRQDGEWTSLLVWQAECPRCSVPFLARSTLVIASLNRRCPTHKSPGHRPGGRKRHSPLVARVVLPGASTGPG